MNTCEVCNTLSTHLDCGVCPSCMISAVQALINGSEDTRLTLTGKTDRDASDLCLIDLITLQGHYQDLAAQDKQDPQLIRAHYKRAYGIARMEKPLAPFTFVRDHESDFPENVAHAAFSSWCWSVFSSDVLARREYWAFRDQCPTIVYMLHVKRKAIAEHRTPPKFKPFSY